MRILSAMPLFGFETSGCHHEYSKKEKDNTSTYKVCNAAKVGGAIPGLGGLPAGIMFVVIGIHALRDGSDSKELGNPDHPKLKAAAFIMRGVVTILGGGVLFTLADIVTTLGRCAIKSPPVRD